MSSNTCGAAGVIVGKGDGFITVRLSAGECASCGCGCRGGGSPEVRIKASGDFSVGDKVIFSQPTGRALKYSVIFYGIPIVFMIISAVIANPILGASEMATAVVSILSILPAWLLAKTLVKKDEYPFIRKK